MWYLVAASNPDEKYVLLVGQEYSVGRKDCDILLTTDPTVSRKHAVLQLAHTESNLGHPQKPALVTLKDVSKFGTFINKAKATGDNLVKDGDQISFGSHKSSFILVNEPYIITTSCLDPQAKKTVKGIVRTVGGHIVSEWTKTCSLLVMNSISVTIKVICALVTQKSIVLPSYLEAYLEHLRGKRDKPVPTEFLPVVSETQVNPEEVSFNPNPNRTSVFKGMKFIFLNQKQFKKMNLAVELAGGMPILMEEGSDDNDDRVLVEPGTVVMNCGPEEVRTLTPAGQEWVAHVTKYLKRKKKTMIQDAEIGYAVLYCSTEKHCNPDIDTAKQLFQHVPSQSLSQSVVEHSAAEVLVQNTEGFPGGGRQLRGKGHQVINESVISPQIKTEVTSQTVSTPGKRKRNDGPVSLAEPEQPPESKRIKEEVVTPAKNSEGQGSRAARTATAEADVREPLESTVARSRSRRQKSPSPKPTSKSPKTATRSPSPKPRSSSPTPTTRSPRPSSRSPSPSRRSSRLMKSEQEKTVTEIPLSSPDKRRRSPSPRPGQSKRVKTETHEGTIDDSSLSLRVTSAEDRTAVRQDENIHDTEIQAKSLPAKSKRRALLDDSDDEDVGLWQTRRKEVNKDSTKQKFPSRSRRDSDSDDNLFDDIPSRRQKTEIKAEVREMRNLPDKISSPRPERSGTSRMDVDSEIEERTSQHRSPKRRKPFKPEVIDDSEEDGTGLVMERLKTEQPESEAPKQGRQTENAGRTHAESEDSTLPGGFLTTRVPIKNQVMKREDFVKEEDLPVSVVVTEFVDLVTKRSRPPAERSPDKDVPDGFAQWNGKLVRNFKKFRKSTHAGSNFLPRIIGGSDLIVHTGNQRKEMDDWFRDALQAESQENERERQAQDLFNWEPKTGSRSKRSR